MNISKTVTKILISKHTPLFVTYWEANTMKQNPLRGSYWSITCPRFKRILKNDRNNGQGKQLSGRRAARDSCVALPWHGDMSYCRRATGNVTLRCVYYMSLSMRVCLYVTFTFFSFRNSRMCKHEPREGIPSSRDCYFELDPSLLLPC